jgi:hypothetical protein
MRLKKITSPNHKENNIQEIPLRYGEDQIPATKPCYISYPVMVSGFAISLKRG